MNVAQQSPHVEVDEGGVAWMRGANLKVFELVREHLAYGWSADELQEQHPYLTLGQIHAALSFFYDHQKEVEAQMQAADREYSRLRALTAESPLQRRARALVRRA